MTQAIALPAFVAPGTAALQQAAGGAATPAAAQGFLAVLAELFGGATPTVDVDGTQVQSAATPDQQNAATLVAATANAPVDTSLLVATLINPQPLAPQPLALQPSQTQIQTQTPMQGAPLTVQIIAGQVAFAANPAATGAPTSIAPPAPNGKPAIAATPAPAAEPALASTAPQGETPTAPQTETPVAPQIDASATPADPNTSVIVDSAEFSPAAQQAQAALLQALAAMPQTPTPPQTGETTQPTGAAIGRTPAKLAAKQGAVPATGEGTTNTPAQPANGKSEPALIAPASPTHASADNANGDAPQLPNTRIEAAAPQQPASNTSAPFVAHLQMAPEPQAMQSAASQAAVPVDALAVHIARKFESGESRFEIRLDPAGLGKLEISMSVDHDGRVHAVVRAERAETLDLLQRDARLLESQLRQSGLNVDSGSLNFSLNQGNGNRQAFAGALQPFAQARELAPEAEQPKTTTAIVSLRDGVDIRV